jgi:hypothetical protein
MADSNSFEQLAQVAHVFKSEENLALRRELKAAKDLMEVAQLATSILDPQRVRNTIVDYNHMTIRCECDTCSDFAQNVYVAISSDAVVTECVFAKHLRQLLEKHGIIIKPATKHTCKLEDRIPTGWYWSLRASLGTHCCKLNPQAHFLTHHDNILKASYGSIILTAKTPEDLKPLLDALDEMEQVTFSKASFGPGR